LQSAIVAKGLVKRFETREGGRLFKGKKRIVETLRGVSFRGWEGRAFGARAVCTMH